MRGAADARLVHRWSERYIGRRGDARRQRRAHGGGAIMCAVAGTVDPVPRRYVSFFAYHYGHKKAGCSGYDHATGRSR
ncbi:hypothetical protein CBM2634_B60131 [Cupriavidus taiwanensis]|uniref:Uncharacterized protein n=1 Tax=Cupriavidus taiwanensis TaxID=164546 RepID=A0A375J955_9BURK|nr:hypothetical protein CBM2634_B60131 [Cupriavidus taiwanensis]